MPFPSLPRLTTFGCALAASVLVLPLSLAAPSAVAVPLPADTAADATTGAELSGADDAAVGTVPASPTGRYFVSLQPAGSAPGAGGARANGSAATTTTMSVEDSARAVEGFEEALEDLSADLDEQVTVTSTHQELWTGAVVEASAEAMSLVQELPQVSVVHPVLEVQLPQDVPHQEDAEVTDAQPTESTETQAAESTEPQATELQNTGDTLPAAIPPGSDGRGVRVAVIDSGLDIDHPAFGGNGRPGTTPFPNRVVVGGHDFVGDAYSGWMDQPVPDARPDDCQGHGTHVASLLAGRPTAGAPTGFSPVAPGASILAYRVFGCSGGTGADVLVAAMERALTDGADVVNLSVAVVDMPWADYPTSVAAQRLVDAGVTVVSSSGNADMEVRPLSSAFATGAPAAAPGVISVGSGTDRTVHTFSLWGPSATLAIKPDVLADGSQRWGAWDLERTCPSFAPDRWCSRSGTSMASAVVAGHVALLLQNQPSLTPEQVRARVAATSQPVPSRLSGRMEPLAKQGSGLLTPASLHSAQISASPSRIELAETEAGPRPVDLALTSTVSGTFTVHHEPALLLRTAGGGATPDSPLTSIADAQVTHPTQVTLTAGRTTRIGVSITPPAGQQAGSIFSGFLTLRDAAGTAQARIRYQGMVGDFSQLPLTRTAYADGPQLAVVASCASLVGSQCMDGEFRPIEYDNRTFTMDGTDVPHVLLRLEYPASQVRIDLLRVTDGGLFTMSPQAAPVILEGGTGRSYRGEAKSYRWDGTYRVRMTPTDGSLPEAYRPLSEAYQVPNGQYRLRVTTTRALPSGAAQDQDRWDSPVFTVRSNAVPEPRWLLATRYGASADLPVRFGGDSEADVYVGDWDGDGVDGIAYRRGNTFYLRQTATDGPAEMVVSYGREDDVVLVGDWDGDGRDTFAVRRANVYHINNQLRGGEADHKVAYGKPDDEVLVGDWNGDRRDTLAVRRANVYHFKNSLTGGAADIVQAFGRAGDIPLSGDYDRDGIDTLALRRGNIIYVRNDFASGVAQDEFAYGRATDIPLVGTWTKGAADTFGVYRQR